MINEGIRIEHLVVYSLFLFFLFKGYIFNFKKKSFTSIIFIFFGIILLVSIGSLVNIDPNNITFLSNFENYVETLILFLILNSLLVNKKHFTVERMLKINTFFHVLLALNTCLIFIEIFTPYADFFQKFYVKMEDGGYRVGTDSMGRYMGIFNQPVESGFAYSLGLLTWLYNFVKIKKNNRIKQGILLVLILIGGIVSVSKVFLIGGILLFTVMFFLIGSFKNKITMLVFSLILLTFLVPIFINDWKGYSILENQISEFTTEFSISNVTAGRIGKEDGIYGLIVNKDSSIYFMGKGYTVGDLPFLDSEYVQIFYQGGGFALILYFTMIIRIFIKYHTINSKFYTERMLLLAILVLALFTAIGGPVFLMNRVRVFFFLQLFFIYQMSKVKTNISSREKFKKYDQLV
tara:strand:+ start:3891 stop:5105 length:1215 start_codon:yes stop_codon:yes gene_type:complete